MEEEISNHVQVGMKRTMLDSAATGPTDDTDAHPVDVPADASSSNQPTTPGKGPRKGGVGAMKSAMAAAEQ